MTVTPNAVITAQAVQTAQAVVTSAKITYTDNANSVLLLTAGPNGSIVYGVTALPQGALASTTKVMLFRSQDGILLSYIRSVLVNAYATDAAATIPTIADIGFTEASPLRLKAGDKLFVGVFAAAANGIAIDCQYEDL
jgi:hypothetical protein